MLLSSGFLLYILLKISNQLPECWSEEFSKNKFIKTLVKKLAKLKQNTEGKE
jgi:hypothetical protein